jgi:urease accessory protein
MRTSKPKQILRFADAAMFLALTSFIAHSLAELENAPLIAYARLIILGWNRGFTMYRRALTFLAAASVAAAAPTIALAHPGIAHVHDLAHGFTHPFTGVDHVIAMLAVGVFAAQLGGRALWLVPGTFIAVMAAAGIAGMMGLTIPYVETGIALSVLALGAVVAFVVRVPVAIAMAMVGLFAVFHGHAHGTEMPDSASGILFGFGFVAATVTLHAIGIGCGVLVARASSGRQIAQLAGGAAVVAGAALLVMG